MTSTTRFWSSSPGVDTLLRRPSGFSTNLHICSNSSTVLASPMAVELQTVRLQAVVCALGLHSVPAQLKWQASLQFLTIQLPGDQKMTSRMVSLVWCRKLAGTNSWKRKL